MLGAALAQSLSLPPSASVGEVLTIRAQGLQPGAYPIEISGPDGEQVITLVTNKSEGELNWIPKKAGQYDFRLYAHEGVVSGKLQVEAPPPEVRLDDAGLHVGDVLLPLPKMDWMDPVQEGDSVYLAARGIPLVLRLRFKDPMKPLAYYPPAGVKRLEPGAVVTLMNGQRAALADGFGEEPYLDEWSKLGELNKLERFWRDKGVVKELPPDPEGYRPYWVYLAKDPKLLSAQDLASWGRDLIKRGHRPELAWGSDSAYWSDTWQRAALAARKDEPQLSRSLTLAMLRYAPLHKGYAGFFRSQAKWLEKQGYLADALTLRQGLRQLGGFAAVLSERGLRDALLALLVAYLALMLVLITRYLPVQRRSLASWGGLINSWGKNPLRRLAHPLLAYASWGERLLALLLAAALAAALLLWGLLSGYQSHRKQPNLDRATLYGAAQSLSDWPSSPGKDALIAYSLIDKEPDKARAKLARETPFAFARALRYRLTGEERELQMAYRLDSSYQPLRQKLGLGGDAWSGVYDEAQVERLGVPRERDLCRVYLWGAFMELAKNPIAPLQAVGVREATWAWLALLLVFAWLLAHLWALLLPRPRGATRAAGLVAKAIELLVPGSTSFGKGWGVVLLLLAAVGVTKLFLGDVRMATVLLLAAFLPHFFLWLDEVRS